MNSNAAVFAPGEPGVLLGEPVQPVARIGFAETAVALAIALQFPPAILGNNLVPAQLALACLALVYLVARGSSLLHLVSLGPLRHFILFTGYLFVAHLVIEPESMQVALQELMIAAIGYCYLGTLLAVARPRDLAVAFVAIHALFCVSYLITQAAFLAGVGRALFIGTFPLKDYAGIVHWYFPCAFYYVHPYADMDRALGPYREPGLFQAFALSAVCVCMTLRDLRFRRSLALVIFVGSFFSFSTAWLASCCCIIAYLAVSRIDPRRVISLLLSIVLVALAAAVVAVGNDLPSFGFMEKLSGESGRDRLQAFSSLAPALSLSPWLGLGQGTLLERSLITSVSGSFIVGVARLGLVGTLIFLVATWRTLAEHHDRRSAVVVVPVLVTMLTSQPLYYSVLAYFIMCLPVRQWRLELRHVDADEDGEAQDESQAKAKPGKASDADDWFVVDENVLATSSKVIPQRHADSAAEEQPGGREPPRGRP